MADQVLAERAAIKEDTQLLGVLKGKQAQISIQYKATHPIWGMQTTNERGLGRLSPNELTEARFDALLEDFRQRVGVVPLAFLAAAREAGILQVVISLDRGVDSSVTFSFVGTFPEGHEFAGLTVDELRDGERVRIALRQPKE